LILQNVTGAKAQYPHAALRKPFLPTRISMCFGDGIMREPVYLNREARRRAIEIENIRSDRVLPPKA
jgi:hypothetical protein